MKHGANGTGPISVDVSRERDFEVFDELPAEVRKALNEASFKYLSLDVAALVATIGAERVAAAMPLSDRRLLEKERAAREAADQKLAA